MLGEKTPLLTWLRLGVNTGVWYLFAVILFPAIQERTGVCSLSEHLTRYRCYKAGHSWSGFDISGHCFLLTWNNLVIIEEIKKLDWSEMKEKSWALYRVSSAVTILLHGLMVIWETMMMATSLYFHSTIEKVLGNKALLKDPTNYWIEFVFTGTLCAIFPWIWIYEVVPVILRKFYSNSNDKVRCGAILNSKFSKLD